MSTIAVIGVPDDRSANPLCSACGKLVGAALQAGIEELCLDRLASRRGR